jgi:hypothetical protein
MIPFQPLLGNAPSRLSENSVLKSFGGKEAITFFVIPTVDAPWFLLIVAKLLAGDF